MARVVVRFAGEGAGVEDLTWAQLGFWQSIEATGQSRTISGVSKLAEGTTVEDVANVLRFVMSRHPALRTRLVLRPDGPPRQRCQASGEIDLEVVEAGEEDPALVADAVRDRYQRAHFDYEKEWPVRMALVCSRGRPTLLIAVYLHLSIDAGGLTALIADVARFRTTGAAPPVSALSPLEQARRQREPATRRQGAASLRHLEHVLRTVPAQRFGVPVPGRERDHVMVRYRSPATLLAARAASTRAGTGTSAVLLAAFAVALARATGQNPVLALVMVSNRFRPGLADSVSAVAQITPLMVDVAGATVGETVGRAARAALAAYKNGYSDPYAQDEVVERVNRERGEVVELGCYYNDRRQQDTDPPLAELPTAEQIRAALPLASLDWIDDPEMPRTGVYAYVDDPPDAIELRVSVDTRYFTAAELGSLVRGMEAAAVQAALEPAASTGVRTAAAAGSAGLTP